jgi:cellobiose phosphorylase
MTAVQQRLVRADERLILLFDPPFDRSTLEPGYIKGYLPGIRENGGQYTHAATWVVLATALLGQNERAVELFGLLNPVHHADSAEEAAGYMVEPYVVAADVYGAPPHTGRGGWTWYTGSASWLYRVGLEAILGFRLRGGRLQIQPCVPAGWPGYEITYHHGSSTYRVIVDNAGGTGRGVRSLTLDGRAVAANAIDLADDGQRHEVRVATVE